jgi:hypothetical protein
LRPVHEETVPEGMIGDAAWEAQTLLWPVHQMTVHEEEGPRIGCGVRCGGCRKSVPQERVAAKVCLGSTHAAGKARDVIAQCLLSVKAEERVPRGLKRRDSLARKTGLKFAVWKL